MAQFRVVKNGDLVIITHSFKNAAKEYDACIYHGKDGDIIRLETRKTALEPWELARKDWL